MTSEADEFLQTADDLRDVLASVLSRFEGDHEGEARALYIVGAFATYFLNSHHGEDVALLSIEAWRKSLATMPTRGAKH